MAFFFIERESTKRESDNDVGFGSDSDSKVRKRETATVMGWSRRNECGHRHGRGGERGWTRRQGREWKIEFFLDGFEGGVRQGQRHSHYFII